MRNIFFCTRLFVFPSDLRTYVSRAKTKSVGKKCAKFNFDAKSIKAVYLGTYVRKLDVSISKDYIIFQYVRMDICTYV